MPKQILPSQRAPKRPTKHVKKTLATYLLLAALPLLIGGCSSMHNPFVPYDDAYNAPEPMRPAAFEQPRSGKNMYRATMKPYCIAGTTYCPTTVAVGERFRGTASWYGPNFHGGLTSNGERYNMYAYTAAHKTLPINTVVKVTNLKNGKTTTVRINDRGPFVKDRIIDLSYQAARDIGLIKQGTAPVELKVISFDETANRYAHRKRSAAPGKRTIPSKKVTKPAHPQRVIVQSGGFSVQIASFSDPEKAKAFKEKCYHIATERPIRIKIKEIAQKPIYTIVIGGFGSIDEAKDYIRKYNYKDAFVVKD